MMADGNVQQAAITESWSSQEYTGRATSHFLPKFDNQNEDKRLAHVLSSTSLPKGRGILYVSKKHSGSLVMAPPFYSKNATGNSFSRVGAVVLFDYFEAVWPGEGAQRFKEWWADAENAGICYSFECVVPRILGDHGATPRGAYMVLTCAALTFEGRFMSPAELLDTATRWRLPLNEVWLFPGDKADKVERELHDRRWTMGDSEATQLLDDLMAPGQKAQRFIPHGEVQGGVLEGFVLMALDADLDEMSKLVATYNKTMEPHLERAIEASKKLGATCLQPDLAKALLKQVELRSIAPLNIDSAYDEPTRMKAKLSADQVWNIVCTKVQSSSLRQLFVHLREVYGHSCSLEPYLYKGQLQVQIHIRDDQVFYGWPLHMLDNSTDALYRGMVVTLTPVGQNGAQALTSRAEPLKTFKQVSKVRIIGIAKLKCLNYMWRTFAVRNKLSILLKRGKEAYLKTIKTGFYRPWKLPKEHREALDGFFSRWADFCLSYAKSNAADLNASYLTVVEDKFLPSCPFPLGKSNEDGTASLPKKQLSVVLLNFSGTPVKSEKLEMLGLDPNSNMLLASVCKDQLGFYTRFDGSFQFKNVKEADLVLVIGPPDEFEDGFVPSNFKAIRGMYKGFTEKTVHQLQNKNPNMRMVLNPTDAEEWLSALGTNSQVMPQPQSPKEAAEVAATRPVRVVVCTLGLPPGGGKSSLFEGLMQRLQGKPDVSYCYRSSDDFKGRPKFEAEFLRCVEGTQSSRARSPKGEPLKDAKLGIVGYDKNIPCPDSAQRLLDLLLPLSKRFDLRVVSVVPETLDHDSFWSRVKKRDPKKHIGLAIGPSLNEQKAYGIFKGIFFDKCEAFLQQAGTAPGAVVSNVFVEKFEPKLVTDTPLDPVVELLCAKIDAGVLGAPLEQLLDWHTNLAGGDGAPSDSSRSSPALGNWCAADICGHPSLHVTLVPPKTNNNDPVQRKKVLDALRKLAGKRISIVAEKYHIARLYSDAPPTEKRRRRFSTPSEEDSKLKQVAFWEVCQLEGLPDELDLGEQRNILHITDAASLKRGGKKKDAADAMHQLRKLEETPDAQKVWSIETKEHPIKVDAVITFYY
eukprot:CAMPEP_0184539334 /NCGR_PEP_ID=MMETSP0198_2-20121128/18081_1 /TAXON_ID=1112570 /ORGANISM="Thraustochytrium sp., Strain LLF1b" /LENGTH=1083 /DNA_ID=CAMNT_0026932863 /DNA_START=62 /DNA_END=3313 /DNA_ORIENTATION=+